MVYCSLPWYRIRCTITLLTHHRTKGRGTVFSGNGAQQG
ncbi:hypothetical protein SXCC_02449 [Gluconacetobacter sp. SXCC-1]|nr:hypothetical protein SXCC_02449 [Gluconacetobacter sp. SXCC-1]